MQVEHEPERQRFLVRTGTGEAELVYAQPRPGVMDLRHTFVPPAERGRGVGEALVASALRHAREEGERIVPTCPFVQEWIAKHPDEEELVADGS